MPTTRPPIRTYRGTTGLKARPLKKRSLNSPPIPRKVYSVSPAPKGFTLTQSPTRTTVGAIERDPNTVWNEETLVDLYSTLSSWATRNNLQIKPLSNNLLRYNSWSEYYVWTKFSLTYTRTPNNQKFFASHKCAGCQSTLKAGQTICSNCSRFANCESCFTAGLTLHGVPGASQQYCGLCAKECSKSTCSNLVSPVDTVTECVSCSPRAACSCCNVVFAAKNLTKHTVKTKDYDLCTSCVSLLCQSCNVPNAKLTTIKVSGTNKKYCPECVQKVYDTERKKLEKWSKDELPTSGNLVLEARPNRPIRTISIETEFDGDGVEVAKVLYRSGLIESPSKLGYSSQGGSRRFPCILKGDSSVSGGELVTYLIDIDDENHAAALLRMTEVMKGCREIGKAKFSSNAGGHIHIDLHNYSIDDLWGLYTIFKYLEMPLYYIAGAGASYGHRSLAGSNYAQAPTGGPYGSREAFARGFRNAGRAGLNLNNFNGALQACVCGAVVTGDWKKCSCNLGKATAEWRLWNAEINPRILYAWIALMQSITAFAQDTTVNESNYEYLPWSQKRFSALAAGTKTSVKSRLEWIHSALPLSAGERDSIVYAMKQSDLSGLGTDYLDSLLTIQNNASSTEKDKPRNPGSRKDTKFSLDQSDSNEAVAPVAVTPTFTVGSTFTDAWSNAYNQELQTIRATYVTDSGPLPTTRAQRAATRARFWGN